MRPPALARLEEARERRALASAERTGRRARSKALRLNVQFARSRWRPLVFICLVPLLTLPIVIVTSEGTWRGVQIGLLASAGPWVAVVAVLLYSGGGASMMSVAAEESTASELRRIKGWRLINDLYIDEQIDHIAVGPGGVIVVETKAAAEPWDRQDRFMADRLERGLDQARRTRQKIEHWRRSVRQDAPVYGALVLWSPQGAPGVVADPPRAGDVSVVPIGQLRQWLADVPPADVAGETVDAVWSSVLAHVRKRDTWSLEHEGPPHRPVVNRLVRSILGPIIGAVAALYVAALATQWFPLLLGVLALGTAAVRFRHRKALGPTAVGWAAANALMLVILLITTGITWVR